MLYIQTINGNNCNVVDTDDNVVDACSKNDLKRIITDNPDLVIKGVGLRREKNGVAFIFKEYKLSESELIRLAGGKAPVCKFEGGRNRYYCPNCNQQVKLNQPSCINCNIRYIWSNTAKNTNKVTGLNGDSYLYISLNGLKAMERDRMFR